MPVFLGETSTSVVQWHPFYLDPSDDLVLVSNDGMHFRASSYRLGNARQVHFTISESKLTKLSSVFKDMIAANWNGTANPASANQPIELDYPAFIIERFLGVVNAPRRDQQCSEPGRSTVPRRFEFDETARCTDSTHISTARASAKSTDPTWQIELLILATEYDDLELAVNVIQDLDDEEVIERFGSVEMALEQLGRIKPSWAAYLHRLLLVEDNGQIRFATPTKRTFGRGRHFQAEVTGIPLRRALKRSTLLGSTLNNSTHPTDVPSSTAPRSSLFGSTANLTRRLASSGAGHVFGQEASPSKPAGLLGRMTSTDTTSFRSSFTWESFANVQQSSFSSTIGLATRPGSVGIGSTDNDIDPLARAANKRARAAPQPLLPTRASRVDRKRKLTH